MAKDMRGNYISILQSSIKTMDNACALLRSFRYFNSTKFD